VSECLESGIEHDGVTVYVLGINSVHSGCVAQLWTVLQSVGWGGAQVVFGVGQAAYQRAERKKEGVWYELRTRVTAEARNAKDQAWSAAQKAYPKGSPNRGRAQREVAEIELPQFWSCAPAVCVDLWEDPWLDARAPSQEDQDEWQKGKQPFSRGDMNITVTVDYEKIKFALRELAETRRERLIDDALSIYLRYEAEHPGVLV
jgi:hypothetical protein